MREPTQRAVPADFQFSQGSLNDYSECPHRFQLRYLEHRAWPALVSEPALEHERRMLQGAAFHRMVQQHLAGIDPARLGEMISEPFPAAGGEHLRRWWENYLAFNPANQPGKKFVEYALVGRIAGFRVIARYDVLIVQRGGNGGETQATILDWKTSTRPARREQLAIALQTRVYRSLLARAGSFLNGGKPLKPEAIRMLYWFAEQPEAAVSLAYNPELAAVDEQILADLILDITRRGDQDFPAAAREKYCLFCVYRSLCQRGVRAGDIEEMDAAGELDLDFQQIEEIAF